VVPVITMCSPCACWVFTPLSPVPIARSIKALEGRAANAADVYIFWLSIVASLQNLFLYNGDIDKDLAGKVTTIMNRWYKEFIDDSPSDIYFTTFFLNPHKSQLSAINCANLTE